MLWPCVNRDNNKSNQGHTSFQHAVEKLTVGVGGYNIHYYNSTLKTFFVKRNYKMR